MDWKKMEIIMVWSELFFLSIYMLDQKNFDIVKEFCAGNNEFSRIFGNFQKF
jgi:hypothetical protein